MAQHNTSSCVCERYGLCSYHAAELARLAMWSLVWIVTGGGEGDDPTYRYSIDSNCAWRGWKESQ